MDGSPLRYVLSSILKPMRVRAETELNAIRVCDTMLKEYAGQLAPDSWDHQERQNFSTDHDTVMEYDNERHLSDWQFEISVAVAELKDAGFHEEAGKLRTFSNQIERRDEVTGDCDFEIEVLLEWIYDAIGHVDATVKADDLHGSSFLPEYRKTADIHNVVQNNFVNNGVIVNGLLNNGVIVPIELNVPECRAHNDNKREQTSEQRSTAEFHDEADDFSRSHKQIEPREEPTQQGDFGNEEPSESLEDALSPVGKMDKASSSNCGSSTTGSIASEESDTIDQPPRDLIELHSAVAKECDCDGEGQTESHGDSRNYKEHTVKAAPHLDSPIPMDALEHSASHQGSHSTRDRIEVDLEGSRVRLDDMWHEERPDAALLFSECLKSHPKPVMASHLEGDIRPNRVKKSLPRQLKKLFHSAKGRGCWLEF